MGKHSGPAVEERPLVVQRKRLLVLGAGVALTLVAWVFLVVRAVDLGSQARNGQGSAWFFVLCAAAGATACLFVTLILGSRILAVLRGQVPPPRNAPPGGRRAAR